MKATDEDPRQASGISVTHRELGIPYYFSSRGRALGQNLGIGDFVRLLGLDDKFELVAIIWRTGSVRVRRIGHNDELYLPGRHVRPWKEETLK